MEEIQKKERKYRIILIVLTILSFAVFIFSVIFGVTFINGTKGSGDLGTGLAMAFIIAAYIFTLIGNCVLSFIAMVVGIKYRRIEQSNKTLRNALFIVNAAMVIANLSFMIYLLLRQ